VRTIRSYRRLAAAALVCSALFAAGIAGADLILPLPARDVGEDCSDYEDGAACRSRLCIDATLTKVCSDYCQTDADCAREGWRCRQVTQGSGERVRFCAPLRHVANP
jgi:hypothetical protein